MPLRQVSRKVVTSVAVVVASFLVLSTAGPANAKSASADDTARFLAGMQPSAGSPLLPLTRDPVWQQHARRFGGIFANVESRQLAKIRAWSSAKITDPQPVLFYMFSGPDFLYANAFFPKQSTYVLAGLEPTGPIPDLLKLPRGSVDQALRNIEVSLQSILTNSFFMTNDMRESLRNGPVKGTIPILYLFMARSGKTVRDVSLIKLDEQGTAKPDDGSGMASTADAAHGVKIVFSGDDGRIQTLYYFSTNIANDGFKASGFAKFCEQLGTGDAFIKSASYLLHRSSFPTSAISCSITAIWCWRTIAAYRRAILTGPGSCGRSATIPVRSAFSPADISQNSRNFFKMATPSPSPSALATSRMQRARIS